MTARRPLLDEDHESFRRTVRSFIEREIAVPEAWILHSQGNDDQAISTLKPLAEKEQKDTEGFSETGDLPATEVFADLLLDPPSVQDVEAPVPLQRTWAAA